MNTSVGGFKRTGFDGDRRSFVGFHKKPRDVSSKRRKKCQNICGFDISKSTQLPKKILLVRHGDYMK